VESLLRRGLASFRRCRALARRDGEKTSAHARSLLGRMEVWLAHQGRTGLTPEDRVILLPRFQRLARDAGSVAALSQDFEGVSRVFDAAVLSRVGTGKKHPHTREARYDYDAFGNIISQTGSTPKSSSSGLMRTRELAATVARGNRVERLLQRVSRVFVGREKTSAHARSLPARESMAASKTCGTPSQQPLPGLV
jgi:YD repeat-containing protein